MEFLGPVHTTLEKSENATIISCFGFMFDENSGWEITSLDYQLLFGKGACTLLLQEGRRPDTREQQKPSLENHLIIILSSFSKSSVLFSIHTKTQS